MPKRLLAGGIEVEYPDGVRLSEDDENAGGLGAAAAQGVGGEPDPVREAVKDFGEFQPAKPFELQGKPLEGLGGLPTLASSRWWCE